MSILQTGKQIGQTIKNVGRMRVILGVFVKHGFRNIIERIELGNLKFGTQEHENVGKFSKVERTRMAFEELGPAFVKLGQLLSTRPDLIPLEFVEEFKKLQDNVKKVSTDQIKEVIEKELNKKTNEIFPFFDENPIGAASIAQVHKAQLVSGEIVVVKVQRPGILKIIEDDLNVLYQLASLIEKFIPELRPFNPLGIVEEFRRTLLQETNFFVEANNIRRFSENFQHEEDVIIPKAYLDYSTTKILVLEHLNGLPLSNPKALTQYDVDRDKIVKLGLRAYLKMVFKDRMFHGDIHPGNFFVMHDNKIGLIDFGVVGILSQKLQTSIASMLLALAHEDYERLANEYIDLAPFNENVNPDVFANELRNLISPFYGLTLKEFNPGNVLMDSASIAGKHNLVLPSELILFFRSIIAIESMGKILKEDFDFLSASQEFAIDLVQERYNIHKIAKDVNDVVRDSISLAANLPRQLKFLLRRMSNPNYAIKIESNQFEDLRKTFELSFNLIFLGLIIGSLILSSSIILATNAGPMVLKFPVFAGIGYAIAANISIVAFINYIKKH